MSNTKFGKYMFLLFLLLCLSGCTPDDNDISEMSDAASTLITDETRADAEAFHSNLFSDTADIANEISDSGIVSDIVDGVINEAGSQYEETMPAVKKLFGELIKSLGEAAEETFGEERETNDLFPR